MQKRRLDNLLVSEGIIETRNKAKGLIIGAKVYVNGKIQTKAGFGVRRDDTISMKEANAFVSRGGEKLDHALTHFNILVDNQIAIDVGASTGGFTDCLIQRGIKKVYAIDVGYGQLDWRLRNDSRVKVMERTNIRYITPGLFDEDIDICVIDVSFISLKLVLPVVKDIITEGGKILALIKPQFEVGRKDVGKNGIVKDTQKHKDVISYITDLATTLGLSSIGTVQSPITGAKGNKEFFIYLHKTKRLSPYMENINQL